MAPPHTIKKNTTTTAKSTSRHAQHSPPKRTVHYTGEDTIVQNDAFSEKMNVDDAESLDTSQQAPSTELQKLVVGMVDAQRARHRVRKQAVHTAYTSSFTALQQSITSLFDEHETQASQAYEAQMHRLQELIRKKGEIEERMGKKVEGLRQGYELCWLGLRKVLKKRVEEMG